MDKFLKNNNIMKANMQTMCILYVHTIYWNWMVWLTRKQEFLKWIFVTLFLYPVCTTKLSVVGNHSKLEVKCLRCCKWACKNIHWMNDLWYFNFWFKNTKFNSFHPLAIILLSLKSNGNGVFTFCIEMWLIIQ